MRHAAAGPRDRRARRSARVRRRLRRRAQRHPAGDRPRAGGRRHDEAWGVMDVLAVTDFPDIRLKCAIHSEHGNILIIPREGGYLVRFYIELDDMPRPVRRERRARSWPRPRTGSCTRTRSTSKTSPGGRSTRSASACATSSTTCRRRTATASRACSSPATLCHTHSAKAGQGMNVSMEDAFNLGWKLAAVLRGPRPAGAPAHLLAPSARRSRSS